MGVALLWIGGGLVGVFDVPASGVLFPRPPPERGLGVTVAGGIGATGFFPNTCAIGPLPTCLPFGSPATAAPTAPPSKSSTADDPATTRRSPIRSSSLSTIAPQARQAAWSTCSGEPH